MLKIFVTFFLFFFRKRKRKETNQRKQKERPWQIFYGSLKTRSHNAARGFIEHMASAKACRRFRLFARKVSALPKRKLRGGYLQMFAQSTWYPCSRNTPKWVNYLFAKLGNLISTKSLRRFRSFFTVYGGKSADGVSEKASSGCARRCSHYTHGVPINQNSNK